jgi:hypothetical protein
MLSSLRRNAQSLENLECVQCGTPLLTANSACPKCKVSHQSQLALPSRLTQPAAESVIAAEPAPIPDPIPAQKGPYLFMDRKVKVPRPEGQDWTWKEVLPGALSALAGAGILLGVFRLAMLDLFQALILFQTSALTWVALSVYQRVKTIETLQRTTQKPLTAAANLFEPPAPVSDPTPTGETLPTAEGSSGAAD